MHWKVTSAYRNLKVPRVQFTYACPTVLAMRSVRPSVRPEPRHWDTRNFFLQDDLNSFCLEGSTYRPTKIAKPTVFQVVLRGIGKSFQSAITAPRISLTGYGNATAQSWLQQDTENNLKPTILASLWNLIKRICGLHELRYVCFWPWKSCPGKFNVMKAKQTLPDEKNLVWPVTFWSPRINICQWLNSYRQRVLLGLNLSVIRWFGHFLALVIGRKPFFEYLTIIPWALVGYDMIDSQRGA